jgi:predicted HTH transcriptional regulator
MMKMGREGFEIEYKKAAGRLPRSLWETYSSFSNTSGGRIVLGVTETDGGYEVTGVESPQKLVDDFWNIVCNKQKVSRNILLDRNVRIESMEGRDVIVIDVPEADRRFKPVFINGDMDGGTYVRYGGGDHLCDMTQIAGMIRDAQDVPNDNSPLAEIPLEGLNMDSVRAYRREFKRENPDSELIELDDLRFLELLGAVGRIGDEMHPTAAGALMFGNSLYTVRTFPGFFLDYREFRSDGPDWCDRISSMRPGNGDNVFDFFSLVSERVRRSLPEPLEFDSSMVRVDDNGMRRAARELLMNALVHADYSGETGVTIDLRPDRLTIANPGLFRIPVDRALEGGMSSPRNPTLFRMFGLIGRSERAGTGVFRSMAAMEASGLPAPEITQERFPSRTVVTVRLRAAEPYDLDSAILTLMSNDSSITVDGLSTKSGVGRSKVYAHLRALMESGIVSREGNHRNGRWVVNSERRRGPVSEPADLEHAERLEEHVNLAQLGYAVGRQGVGQGAAVHQGRDHDHHPAVILQMLRGALQEGRERPHAVIPSGPGPSQVPLVVHGEVRQVEDYRVEPALHGAVDVRLDDANIQGVSNGVPMCQIDRLRVDVPAYDLAAVGSAVQRDDT